MEQRMTWERLRELCASKGWTPGMLWAEVFAAEEKLAQLSKRLERLEALELKKELPQKRLVREAKDAHNSD